MPKAGEIDYLKRLGPAGAEHALGKPFSDPQCGRYLVELGTVMQLLPPPPARILDLGVGSGWTSVFLALRGHAVVGQDIAPDMIALAEQNRTRFGAAAATFVTQDYEMMNFREEFDGALFYDTLHHAENEEAAICCAFAALKPGGVCITVEPGEGHARADTSRHAIDTFAVTEKDMPPHHIIDVARRAGFREFQVYGRPGAPAAALSFGPGDAVPPRPRSRWTAAGRHVEKAFRTALKGLKGDEDALLRQGHIVWMRK
jgi:SAM-dependent methyltransferase